MELSCFFDDPVDVGNLIYGSSAFSKSSLTSGSSQFTYCWSLAWRILSITLPACGCHDLSFLILSLKWALSLFSFTLIKRHFSSSSLSAIRVVSSGYLRLFVLLSPILIPACNSWSPTFLIMYSAYRLNKQGNSRQRCCILSPILNQTVVPYRVLTVASCPTYRFLRRQVRWSGIPISLRAFHSLSWSRVKDFSVVHETEVDVKFPCFLYNPANAGNVISNSSSFSKPSLNIWKFLVFIMLKPIMQDFKHDLTSMGDEYNYLMIRISFSIYPSLELEWELTFPVLWLLLGLPDLLI